MGITINVPLGIAVLSAALLMLILALRLVWALRRLIAIVIACAAGVMLWFVGMQFVQDGMAKNRTARALNGNTETIERSMNSQYIPSAAEIADEMTKRQLKKQEKPSTALTEEKLEEVVRRALPELRPPSFHEPSPEQMTVTVGGATAIMPTRQLAYPGVGVIGDQDAISLFGLQTKTPTGATPIRMYVKSERLYVDLKVFDMAGKPPIEVVGNEFKVRHADWDRNSSQNAIEVINSVGYPVFQLVRTRSDQIVIRGLFPFPDGSVFIASGNSSYFAAPGGSVSPNLKPIFKYPSWKYPGQYVE